MARSLLLIPLALLVLFAAAVGWIAGTAGGLRWAVDTLADSSGGAFSAGTTEGRLVERATVHQLAIKLARQKIEIESLTLDVQPSALLAGTIGIRELALKNIRIQDNTPSAQEAPDLLWPRLPLFMDLFDLVISRFSLDRLTYRHLNGPPLVISGIQAKAAWQRQHLSLHNLALTTAQGSLSGKIGITFRAPSLESALDFVPAQPMADIRRISVATKFLPGKGDEQVAGSFTVAGHQPSGPLQLNGVAGITRNSVNLRAAFLTIPDLPGRITADGALILGATAPLLSLRLHFERLNLERLVKERTALTGTVRLNGTAQAYSGSFDLKNSGDRLHSGNLAGNFQGTAGGLTLQSFTGTILGGAVSGKLQAVWSDGITISGLIRGRNFNPETFAPGWKGLLNADLSGSITHRKNGHRNGVFKAVLLDSALHGHALTGKADLTVADQELVLEKLQVQGHGFDLSASGTLNRILDFKARVSDLSRLVPDSGGALTAHGWVRLRNAKPDGAITVTGRNLSRNSITVENLRLSALLGEAEDYPLQLDAKLDGLVYGNARISNATLAADGTAVSHRAQLTVRSREAEARLAVSGRYTDQEWNGMINTASGRDSSGPWSLQAPAGLLITKDSLTLSPLVIGTPDGERLELAISGLRPAPLSGTITFGWNSLNLSRANPWLNSLTLTGRSNGALTARLEPGQRFSMTGSTTLGNGRVRSATKEGVIEIPLRTASANWNWHGETLEGSLALALAEHGDAKGSFRLPLPATFPVAAKPDGPIQGLLTGKVKEQGMLSAFFPELVQESRGDLDFSIRAAGAWKEPKLSGTVSLTRAGGYIPRAGLRLKNITLSAVLEKELIRIAAFRAESGNGYLSGKAELRLKGGKLAAYSGSISGRDFQAVFFPELHVVGSPELTFSGTAEKLAVRGDVKLPLVHINGKQRTGVVTPSKDVVLEGRKAPQEKKRPLDLDIRVRLLLGENVLVKAQGIDARLGGGMELQIQGPEKISSTGEIRVVKGRYKAYGINLEIVRGSIFYAGSSITQPTLDILALRATGDTKAGVTVGGTLHAPVVRLYSEPAMPDADILSYIVLGRPLGQSAEQAGLLTQAAGVLLSAGQSVTLQEQIKSRLGLSTLELHNRTSTTSYMGYRPVTPSTQTANSAAATTEGLSRTILTVGKYLTPQLYISYGRSIFTGENSFLLRYDIFRNWQIETQTGNESGADLYYRIEFN